MGLLSEFISPYLAENHIITAKSVYKYWYSIITVRVLVNIIGIVLRTLLEETE